MSQIYTFISQSQSSDGTKRVAAADNGLIYTSTDAGDTWIERPGARSRQWTSVSSSANGNHLVAVAMKWYISTSSDAGETWTLRRSAGSRAWKAVTMSPDGSNIVAADGDWGLIQVSTDFGHTWKESSSGRALWQSLAWGDGMTVTATSKAGFFTPKAYAPAYNHISTNGGMTWNIQGSSPSDGPGFFLTSSDSNKLLDQMVSGARWLSYRVTEGNVLSDVFFKPWTSLFPTAENAWQVVSPSSLGFFVKQQETTFLTYRSKSKLPESFQDQVFAYNPSQVSFVDPYKETFFNDGFQYLATNGELMWQLTSTNYTILSGPLITYRTKFHKPHSFEDYVFVYDPTEVYFDVFSVRYKMQRKSYNSGRLNMNTEERVFPDDASKRMISLPLAAGSPSRRYTQPSSDRDPNFLVSIVMQFFFHSTPGRTCDLAKFQDISTMGQFMVKKNGIYVDIEKSPRPYR